MAYRRFLKDKLLSALSRSPALLLLGARQSGKTSLVKAIASELGLQYTTFDNLPTLASAHADPLGFIRSARKPMILDEVQRAIEVFLPIKEDIDQNRVSGRYLLTGSANPLIAPKLGDSLAGRMLVVELYPLSQGEILGKKERFLEKVFSERLEFASHIPFTKPELIERIVRGGYPEVQAFSSAEARSEWADAYLLLILQKDIRDLANIEGLSQIPNLLITIAAGIASLLDYGNLVKDSGIPLSTLRRYVQLLHSLFIVHTLPAWSRNLKKRLTKAPKIFLVDTLLLLHLLNLDADRLAKDPRMLGRIAENFVVLELLKQSTWSEKKVSLSHFHNELHQEIDIILEDEQGKIVGIEVKSSETVSLDDFKHFKILQQEVGADFVRGIVLYAGHQTLSFGLNLVALPIAALWSEAE